MTFRPYPILTLVTLPALALLIWLGSWQLDRRAWKAELIGAFEQTAALPPTSLNEILCTGSEDTLGRSVAPSPLSTDAELFFYGIGPEGAPGWRVFSTIPAPDCYAERHMLIEVRFEPLMAARANVDGRGAVVSEPSSWRLERPRTAGPFTPANAIETAEFHSFSLDAEPAMGLQDGTLSPDWWVARDTGEPPAYLTQTPPERHVGYAVTWFLMAIALIGIYFVFHVRAGRLRFSKAA